MNFSASPHLRVEILRLLLWPILWWGFATEALYCGDVQLAPPVPLSIDLSRVSPSDIEQTVRHLQAIVRASEARALNLEDHLAASRDSLLAAEKETGALQATVNAQTAEIAELQPWRGKCIRLLLILSGVGAFLAFRATAALLLLWLRIAAALAAGASCYGLLLRFL